jgi:hypothetical protein
VLAEVKDVHDVYIKNDLIYVVSTGANQVLAYDFNGILKERFVFPGEGDSYHINCLAEIDGQLTISAFGKFSVFREWTGGRSKGNGFISKLTDINVDNPILSGLDQPHSQRQHKEFIYYCNSRSNALCRVRDGRTESLYFEGYFTRGLAFCGNTLYVGLSASRNIETGFRNGAIAVVDLLTLQIKEQIQLPFAEVYDIAVIDSLRYAEIKQMYLNDSGVSNLGVYHYVTKTAEEAMSRLSAEANERMKKRIDEVSEGYEKEIARVGEENQNLTKNIESEWITRNNKLRADYEGELERLSAEANERMQKRIEEVSEGYEKEIARVGEENRGHLRKIIKMEQDPFWREMLPIRGLGRLIKNGLLFSGDGVKGFKVDIVSDGGRLLIIKVDVGPEVMCRLNRVWVKIGDKRVDLKKNAQGYYAQYRSGRGLKLISVIAKFSNGRTKVIKNVLRVVSGEKKEVPVLEQKSLKWGIVTPKHTLFIAKLVESGLKRHGYASAVFTDTTGLEFDLDMYVVICPQVFKNLPPGEKRICYQMEQSVSSRWFNKEYLDVLGNSFAVIEYALANMEFLAGNSIAFPHVHYLPVGNLIECISSGLWRGEKECDVLFYGDSYSSPRRRLMLDELSKVFVVKVVNDLFGAEMASVIMKAKLVLNLHYYENALLEMPRIQECLSHGVPVVSESSFDQNEYPEIEGVVSFFEQSSIPGMIAAVESMLAKPPTEGQIRSAVQRSASRFEYMFDRFLVALSFLPALHVKQMVPMIEPGAKRVALSMPETIARRREFEAIKPQGCTVFDGIRRKPGWVGCGLSYMAIAQHAINNGMDTITVMEDDVILPVDFEDKMSIIGNYLSLKKGNWDVFSGLIASLNPKAVIVEATNYQGILFVTLDKMTSTVCNVYNRTALEVLGSWDPNNLDSKVNTIDRYIENQRSLRVVTTIPFLVGHKEEVYSTLWGFKNTQYVEWIKNSEAGLREMVLKFNNKKQK